MSDLEARLRDALHELAPADPHTGQLASGALRYHARARRRRLAAVVIAAAAVLVGSGLVLGALDRPAPVLPSAPLLTPGDCASIPAPARFAPAAELPSFPADAVWICPDTSISGGGDGWSLPAAPLLENYARTVTITSLPASASGGPVAQVDESRCGPVRLGPAFTVTFQSEQGQVSSYRSADDVCRGAQALRSFLEALADQEADMRAAVSPDVELACRSQQRWIEGDHGWSLDSPLVAARLCFAPRNFPWDPDRPIQPMVPRSYQSSLLRPEVVAMLNRDMTSPDGFFGGNGDCSGEGAWVYSIVGRTQSGQYRMLATTCLDELWVVGIRRYGFIPSADTTAELRRLVPPTEGG